MDTDPSGRSPLDAEQARSSRVGVQKPRRIFYGWWIVVAATLASTIQSAVFNVGAQALVLPLIREFDATRAAVPLAFPLRRLEGGLAWPVEW